jgi:hypothetical protein
MELGVKRTRRTWKDLERTALDRRDWKCGCRPMPPGDQNVKKNDAKLVVSAAWLIMQRSGCQKSSFISLFTSLRIIIHIIVFYYNIIVYYNLIPS